MLGAVSRSITLVAFGNSYRTIKDGVKSRSQIALDKHCLSEVLVGFAR